MHTLDDLWANQGAFRDDTLERNHPIQMNGPQCPGVTGELSKGSDISAIIVLDVLIRSYAYIYEM